LCPFLAAGIEMETIVELLTAATGMAFTKDELMQVGQTIGWQSA
jgi:aldehyde:ferredoxin oxidoreductase